MVHLAVHTGPVRGSLVIDLPLSLDRQDARRLPVQLADQIRLLITSGHLRPGDQLPSSRQLAIGLELSRGSVMACYDQLQAEGYLVAAHGSGTAVNPHLDGLHPAPSAAPPRSGPARRPVLVDLRPGLPDTASLTDSVWRGAWRGAACHFPAELTDPLGLWALRAQICEHLRQMRGLITTPEQIMVSAGAREGLSALLRLWRGGSQQPLRIGVESPGYPSMRKVASALGDRLVDLATDGHGLRTDRLPGPGEQHLDAVLVTPSHQYPYGGSLSAPRRTALTSWAAGRGCWLVEDDFDSEVRHIGSPLPALTATAPEITVLLGTFSCLLAPSVACGYLVLPPDLVTPMTRQREALGQPVGSLVQEALAGYLSSGALRRRTQRMRQVYRRRRDIVVDSLAGLPGAVLQPVVGGLQAVLVCRADEEALVSGCAGVGVGVAPLSSYWGGQGTEHGLVIGFGAHDDATLAESLHKVASVVRAVDAAQSR